MNKLNSIYILLWVFFSCNKIEATNPFDTDTPKQLYTPDNFQANQTSEGIELNWSSYNKNVSGFKIKKRFDNGTEINLVTISKDSTHYIDTNLLIGKNHNYTLSAYTSFTESNSLTIQILPTFKVETQIPNSITVNSALLYGNIVMIPNANIKIQGFEIVNVLTGSKATISQNYQSSQYSLKIENLTSNTLYSVRAFARDEKSFIYAKEIKFNTKKFGTPSVITGNISNIFSSSISITGLISDDGGSPILESGIVYSNTPNPTLSNSKKMNLSNLSNYTIDINGLNPSTSYYAKAYATNSLGTGYGEQISFITSAKTSNNGTVLDIDGNVYSTVSIGNQVWMTENLRTTKYNDGTQINNNTSNITWNTISIGSYCWYDNNISNKSSYGALYNFYAINTGKVCPVGWHVPSNLEWEALILFLGGNNVAGGKLKDIGTSKWASPNSNASNSSGFKALPSGSRRFEPFSGSSIYKWMSTDGIWWSSILLPSNNPNYNPVSTYSVNFNSSVIYNNISEKYEGNAVRCIGN